MTLTGPDTGLLQFAVKGHEIGPFHLKDFLGGERGGLGEQYEVGANYSGGSATAAALR
jgi:hypothetical protein